MTEKMKKDYANINATYGTQAKEDDFKICLEVKKDLQNEIEFQKKCYKAAETNNATWKIRGFIDGLDWAIGTIKKHCNNVYGVNSTEIEETIIPETKEGDSE